MRVSETIADLVQYSELKRIFDKIAVLREQQQIKSIAILSESVGEGKTLIATALALSMSQLLRLRILIVDTQSYAHSHTLKLTQTLEMDELAQPVSGVRKTLHADIDLFSLHAARRQDKHGLEHHLDALVRQYSQEYDLLIFDTNAMSAINRNNVDPLIVARHTDTSLLVMGRKNMAKHLASDSFGDYSLKSLKVSGIVLNEGPLHAK